MQVAPGQGGFEHVGGIHRTFGSASTHKCVQLVDEEYHLSVGFSNFLQNGFEALFELTAVLCAGEERAHVQGHDPAALEAFRNISIHDSLGQALNDCGFTHARITD